MKKYSDIIDYQKVDFCSKSIGLYALKNYEDLKTLDLNVVSPVYLDNFMLKKIND